MTNRLMSCSVKKNWITKDLKLYGQTHRQFMSPSHSLNKIHGVKNGSKSSSSGSTDQEILREKAKLLQQSSSSMPSFCQRVCWLDWFDFVQRLLRYELISVSRHHIRAQVVALQTCHAQRFYAWVIIVLFWKSIVSFAKDESFSLGSRLSFFSSFLEPS